MYKIKICCPQCGNERLEETSVGWYICCDKDCDWGDKLQFVYLGILIIKTKR